jgi:hypothetical protein
MTKRKRIYGDGPRVGRDRSGPAPPQGRRGPAPAPTLAPKPVLAPRPRTSELFVSAPKRDPTLLARAVGEGAITDAEGLARAYAQGDTYSHGGTLYVAGSHTAQDWWDDVTKIPFWGKSHDIYRLQQAQKALAANPQTTRVVGHSLGGSVALQLQKDNPKLASRTFGAPVFDIFGTDSELNTYAELQGKPEIERYRSYADPVSFFDASATSTMPGKEAFSFSGPHAYDGIASQHMSDGLAAQENPDGTVSITE